AARAARSADAGLTGLARRRACAAGITGGAARDAEAAGGARRGGRRAGSATAALPAAAARRTLALRAGAAAGVACLLAHAPRGDARAPETAPAVCAAAVVGAAGLARVPARRAHVGDAVAIDVGARALPVSAARRADLRPASGADR